MYCSVPQIHPPPLSVVQNAGGPYTRDATIFLAITPFLPAKHDLIVDGGWGPSAKTSRAQGREMLPMLAVG